MTRAARVCSWCFVGAVLVFLFLPVVLVVLFSFNASSTISLPFTGFSLQWYRKAFSNTAFTDALEASAIVALTTGVVVTLVGTAAAYALNRRKSRLLVAVTWLVMVPAVLPGLFLAVALLSFYNEVGIDLTLRTVVVGHVLVTLPFTVLIVGARLAELDRSIEEAARDCGATARQTFTKIVLPLIAPALFGSLLIAVAMSVDEIVIALFTVGEQPTLPVTVWVQLRRTIDPSINALASTILFTTVLATVVAQRLITPRSIAR